MTDTKRSKSRARTPSARTHLALADYAATCYKRNHLSDVIVRVDLLSPLPGLADTLPPELSARARSNFPIPEPRRAVTQRVELTPEKVSAQNSEFTEFRFHGRERDKTLTIAPSVVLLRYTTYSSYERLRTEFTTFLDAFFGTYPHAQVTRLGLRYINRIEPLEADPLQWGHLINDRLLGLLDFRPEGSQFVRVFHNVEYRIREFQLRFQFGLHNPDYPAVIKRKLFTLDLDASYEGLQEPTDIPERLDSFHFEIQRLFEQSVTQTYRDSLNA